MGQTKFYIKLFRHVALMSLVLFSLAPCSVKQSISDAFEIPYQKPLNKTKTTQTGATCQLASIETQRIVLSQQKELKKQNHPSVFFSYELTASALKKLREGFPFQFAGSSPPKYILYKRLKIDPTYFF